MSDDDESLTINQSPLRYTDESIEVDDIVWAKWKGTYWPALVRKCCKEKKTATIVYIDEVCNEDGKELVFQKKITSLLRCNGSQKSQQLMFQHVEDGVLRNAIENAKQYIMKKTSGNLYVSPLEYFRNPISNLLADPNINKRKLETTETDIEQESKSLKTTQDDDTEVLENVKTSHSDEEETDENTRNIVSKLGAKISSVVTSEECSTYLERVRTKEEPSTRHASFFGPMSVKQKLKFIVFSSFLSQTQYEDIVNHIQAKFEKQITIKVYCVISYIFDVLVPEALMFGLQKVLDISKEKASLVLQGERISELENEKLIAKFGDELNILSNNTQ